MANKNRIIPIGTIAVGCKSSFAGELKYPGMAAENLVNSSEVKAAEAIGAQTRLSEMFANRYMLQLVYAIGENFVETEDANVKYEMQIELFFFDDPNYVCNVLNIADKVKDPNDPLQVGQAINEAFINKHTVRSGARALLS